MELNNLISHFPFEIFNQKFKMYLISGLLNIIYLQFALNYYANCVGLDNLPFLMLNHQLSFNTNLFCYGINKECCLKICSEIWPSTNGTCICPLSCLWEWTAHNIQTESKTNYLKYLSFTITQNLFAVINCIEAATFLFLFTSERLTKRILWFFFYIVDIFEQQLKLCREPFVTLSFPVQ